MGDSDSNFINRAFAKTREVGKQRPPRWLTQQLTHRLLQFSSSAPRAALAKRADLTNAAWSVEISLPKVLAFRRSQGLSDHRSRRETPQRNRNELGETTVNKTRRKRPLLEEKSIT
jgi:hypothetical protein